MSAVKSPAGAAGAKSEDSLWLKLLQQNSARSITPDSTVLVLGGNTFQRKDVLQSLAQSSQLENEGLGELELVNNSFFEVDDSTFDTPVKVNLWGFHDKLLSHVPQIIKSADSHQLAALILLESNDDIDTTVSVLQQRLQQVGCITSALLRQLPAEKVKAWKEAHRKYLCSVPYLKNGTKFTDISAEDREAVWMSCEGNLELSVDTFPIPILVAVFQSDVASAKNLVASPGNSASSSTSTLSINKELQGKLRLLCLDAGATLCGLPSLRNQASDAQIAMQRIRKYLLHRLYPSQLQVQSSSESSSASASSTDSDSTVPLFNIADQTAGLFLMPSGLDTANLIEIATREKATDRVSLRQYLATHPTTSIASSATSANTETSSSHTAIAFQEIENEHDWLTNLHKFLSQVADTSPSTAASSSASVAGAGTGSSASSGSMRRASSAYGSQNTIPQTGADTAASKLSASSSSDKLADSAAAAGSTTTSSSSSSHKTTAGAGAGEKRVPAVTRKPSMISASTAANQNAKDFFSSLMSDKK